MNRTTLTEGGGTSLPLRMLGAVTFACMLTASASAVADGQAGGSGGASGGSVDTETTPGGMGPAAGISGGGVPISTEDMPQVSTERALTLEGAKPVPTPAYSEEVQRLKELYESGKMPQEAQGAEQPPVRDPAADEAGTLGAPESAAPDEEGASEAPAAADIQSSFQGITYTGWFPPDPIIAAGRDHLIAMVNTSWAIFDKQGNNLFQIRNADWWDNVLPTSAGTPFDPRIIYDQYRDRWVMLAVSRTSTASEAWYVLSVSDDENPFGGWCNFALRADLDGASNTNNWADFPDLGYDDTGGVYLTSNQFAAGGGFQYAKLRVLQKDRLYNTSCPGQGWWDFWRFRNADGSLVFTWRAARTYGNPGAEFLVNTESPGSGNAITVWRVLGAGDFPPVLQRIATKSIPAYSAPSDAQQRGGGRRIDTGDARLWMAVYRDGWIYTAMTRAFDWDTGDGVVESVIRWFQFDATGSDVAVDRSFGLGDFWYFYPAAYPDDAGNIYLVFSRSGPSEFAGTRHTVQMVGQGPQASAQLKGGEANYEQIDSFGRNRWGDYGGAYLDGSNTASVWLFHEYAESSPADRWGTWTGSALVADNRDLVLDFGLASPVGLWLFRKNADFESIVGLSPTTMALGDLDGNLGAEGVLDFDGLGLWNVRDDGWRRLTSADAGAVAAGDLDGSGLEDAIGSFGSGLWVFMNDSTWRRIASVVPTRIAAGDLNGNGRDEVVADFPSIGTWIFWDNSVWRRLFSGNTRNIVVGDINGNGRDDVVVDLSASIWMFRDGTTWQIILGATANGEPMTTGDMNGNGRDEIVISLSSGTWARFDNATWQRLTTGMSEALTSGDLDRNGRDDIVGVFASGTWARMNNNVWTRLTASKALKVASGDFEAD